MSLINTKIDYSKYNKLERLNEVYNKIVDDLISSSITSNEQKVSQDVFFKRLATWMALAMVGRAIDIVENEPTRVKYLNIDDICKLPDDLNGLQTVDDIKEFINGLNVRANHCDGKPFGNWSVRDIVGTIRNNKLNDYFDEFLTFIIDTPAPDKK